MSYLMIMVIEKSILLLAIEVFSDEWTAKKWLNMKMSRLNNLSPVDYTFYFGNESLIISMLKAIQKL